MPARKSTSSTGPTDANGDVSMVSNATTSSTHAHPKPSRQSGGGKQGDGVSIDDLLLPRTLTSRLARGVLPANTQIQKDAVLAIAKSATVFISYLAHHANEQTSKKTIGPQDVLNALKEIEMDGVMQLGAVGSDGRLGGRLERELEAYEEIIKGKRKGYRDKVKARESHGDADAEDERGEPSSKKARRMSGDEDVDDEDERMLEQQLNGAQGSSPNTTGKSNGTSSRPNGEADVEEVDEAGDEEHDDEDDEEDEDDAGEDEEDQDDEADVDETEADDAEELEERVNTDERGRIALMPDGNVEMGSEDESE
ncbi:histone-fold-containing protein [Exophiala viscosa]|uniref:histone-fold-containing protein n=1 Tax=Exophiala viscosa TaxID=2486360 RepID=UPI0021955C1A|nr:histone-fold-containing protein [Exophiala viscosa]